MNKLQFVELLDHPERVNENTLSELKEIIEEYPFFQAGRMLLIKNLHKIDHIKYNSELRNSAAYIADRSKLFHLIHTIQEEPEPVVEEIEETVVEKSEPVIEQQEEKAEKDQPISVTATENYLNASDEFEDANGSLVNFNLEEKEIDEEEVELQNLVLPAADLLDYDVTTTSNYSLPSIDEIEKVSQDENRSFSDWLHIMHYTEAPKNKEKEKPRSKGMDLIDSFLNSKPKIEAGGQKKTKDGDLSAKSASAPEDILSETLAEIHIKQGNKSKAISIFEKLRLKYPEKNVYFARRISELKEN